MKIGSGIPTCREGVTYPAGLSSPQSFIDIAQAADELGFASLWTNDHTLPPPMLRDDPTPPEFHEPHTILSFLAGKTERIRLLHGALIAPVRGTPVLMARQAVTLDQVSNGRHVLGLCIGGYRDEFLANVPAGAKINRGGQLDECFEALRALLDTSPSSYHGDYYDFENIVLWPKSVQARLPVYYAGNVDSAIERAGRYSDGWIYIGLSTDVAREKVKILHEAARSVGREPKDVAICPQVWVATAETQSEAEEIARTSGEFRRYGRLDVPPLIVGTPDLVIEKFKAFQSVGADEVGAIFHARTTDELVATLKLVAREVMPAVA